MEKGKALSLLRKYKRTLITTMPLSPRGRFAYYFYKQTYSLFLCDWLSEGILHSDLDPIVVVKKFRDDMEFLLGESESSDTHTFACYMSNCAGEILKYLTLEDKK